MDIKKLPILLIAIPLLAHAANWTLVSLSTEGDKYFIDTQSITRSGDSVTFWVKKNYASRDKYGDLSAKVNETVNCRTRESNSRYMMFFDDLDNHGKQTSSFSPKDKAWEPIPPESVSESQLKFVCKYK